MLRELLLSLPLADAAEATATAVHRLPWQAMLALVIGLPIAVMGIAAYECRMHLGGILRAAAHHSCIICKHEWSDNNSIPECPRCGSDHIHTHFSD